MFIFFQKILPKNLLSRLLARLAHWRWPPFKNWAIRSFSAYFSVDLSESQVSDINQFSSFNDFFIRRLRPDARAFSPEPADVISPADGIISQLGDIRGKDLIQAKGINYTLSELFNGDEQMARYFENGEFITVYLAPKDYHRVHMPIMGILRQMYHVPGKLFSVNSASVSAIPKLFARNERVINLFATVNGPMAVILVGACLVGSASTAWHGVVMPSPRKQNLNIIYEDAAITLQKGEELGYFQWGSTVIVLFAQNCVKWRQDLQPGDSIRVGQTMGKFNSISTGPIDSHRQKN